MLSIGVRFMGGNLIFCINFIGAGETLRLSVKNGVYPVERSWRANCSIMIWMRKKTAGLHRPRFRSRLLADLRARIAAGEFPADALLPPEAELAERYQVSRATVRLALQELAVQGLVQRRPGKGTFVAGPLAPSENARKRSRLVGFVAPSEKDTLLMDILNGAESVLRDHDYSLIYESAHNDSQIEANRFEDLLAHDVAGIIIFPLAEAEEAAAIRRVLAAGVPVVLVDREVNGVRLPVVMADHFAGAYEGVHHLLALGHRRVVCVAHPSDSSSVRDRIAGYQQAMRDASLLPYATVTLRSVGQVVANDIPPVYTEDDLADVAHVLSVPAPPTAVFCINDYIAIRVSQFILSRGLRIPQDVAVLGFDNNSFAAFAPVPLTTLAQPSVDIGVQAARLLLRKIAGEAVADAPVFLRTRLVLRVSSG